MNRQDGSSTGPDPLRQDMLDRLATEAGGAAAVGHEERSTLELVQLMNDEDALVPAAVRAAASDIAAAIDAVVARLAAGGRLVYVGAGTSGGLAALDAAECEATFSTVPGQVVALVAGRDASSPREREAAEDDREAGADAVRATRVSAGDAVLLVSASGRTPYVLGAAEAAAAAGALTIGLASVRGSKLAQLVDRAVVVVVGPEFLAGSTRLKAGTAQKLVLNLVSTISMIRLGKTFGNLMVAVAATNEKLRARVRRIVATATGADGGAVDDALAAAGGDARVAIVSLLAGVDAADARTRLDAANQSIREAVRR